MATLDETLVYNDVDEAFETYEESLNLSEYSSGQSTFDSGKFIQVLISRAILPIRSKSAYFPSGYMLCGLTRTCHYCILLQIANLTTTCPDRRWE